MDFIKAVQSDDRRESLEALRDQAAANIEAANPGEVAGLLKQLREILADIDALPRVQAEVTPLERIRNRYAANGDSGAANPPAARRRGQPRAG